MVEYSPSMQSSVKIDLKALDAPPSEQSKNTECSCFNLVPEGYDDFVSTGAGGYNIEITKPENEGKKTFDNCVINKSRHVCCNTIASRTYRITNT